MRNATKLTSVKGRQIAISVLANSPNLLSLVIRILVEAILSCMLVFNLL